MNAQEMRALVKVELEGIPRGSYSQNVYRAMYEQCRLNGLGRKAEIPPTVEAAHEVALRVVRQSNPGFSPDLGSR